MTEDETPQENRYATAVRAWEAARGQPADRRWRALFALATADAGLWAWVQPRVDVMAGRVALDDRADAELNPSQRLLLAAARGLYGEDSPVNLAALADELDERQFATVLAALQAYRQDTEPMPVTPAENGPARGC